MYKYCFLPFREATFQITQPIDLSFESVANDTKTRLECRDGRIKATLCHGGFTYGQMDIMPDIIDVRVGGKEENKVVFVDFADNTTQKAILDKNDVFSLEQGISICITKKLLDIKCGAGGSVYNKIIRKARKVFDKKEEAKNIALKNKEEEEKKCEKVRRKKELRKSKLENAERERQIEIQKEAYLRAMREYNSNA